MRRTDETGAPKRVCVLGLGGGGFHLAAERILAGMHCALELVLVYTSDTQTTENWSSPFPVVQAFVVRSPSLHRDSLWRRAWTMAAALWCAFWVLLACEPDCLLAVGTAQAVPFGLAARLLAIPMVFIESITRVNRHSRTGKLVSRLRLASQHFVQWETLAAQDHNTVYSGSLIR
jgi:UDP-N-acetylglucosamine:LPS N-acetylglucosamine transferase